MPGAANVISGNRESGIDIEDSCLIEGNLIGTNTTGAVVVSNPDGIFVGEPGATIGGTTAGAADVISGNFVGIAIEASCLVEGNLIGTNATGTSALGNEFGILMSSPGATIGGISSAVGNIISGNSIGVSIEASCLIEGCNLIGTNSKGTSAVANGDGIFVGEPGATIRGTSAAAANVVSGNGDGIDITAFCVVEGNVIGTDKTGTDPVPNSVVGVHIEPPAFGNPGGANISGNKIAFNSGPGVGTAPGTTGVTIRFNSIYGNGGPGIDLNNDGVTANTLNGPNNAPVLRLAADGIITGTLIGPSNSEYVVDFYTNPESDASAARGLRVACTYMTSTMQSLQIRRATRSSASFRRRSKRQPRPTSMA